MASDSQLSVATFAGGCFWCTEAIFKRLRGVKGVLPGYSGGKTKNPTYQDHEGHAESIQIEFNPEEIPFKTLLEVFFHTHDPTTLNRQGADVGPAYRSAIFVHDAEQERQAQEVLASVQSDFDEPIVTSIEPFTGFTEAEDYHKNYYENNKDAGYCKLVIDPKIKKLLENYSHLVK